MWSLKPGNNQKFEWVVWLNFHCIDLLCDLQSNRFSAPIPGTNFTAAMSAAQVGPNRA